MKLGFWNRLAIVATGLALLIVPLWAMIDNRNKSLRSRYAIYELCLDQAWNARTEANRRGVLSDYVLDRKVCDDHMKANPGYLLNWKDWFQGAGAILAFCVFIYGLIWVVVWVGRWIWRGREQGE